MFTVNRAGDHIQDIFAIDKANVEEIKPEVIQPVGTGTETVLLAEDER